MKRMIRYGRVVGFIDDSDTQSNGMLIPVCYLETYDHPEEMVEYYANLIRNAEPMMDLLKDIYYNYEVGGDVDKKIEKLLGDLL